MRQVNRAGKQGSRESAAQAEENCGGEDRIVVKALIDFVKGDGLKWRGEVERGNR
ncbi:MAG: hypothetical protein M3458_20060 [Acidobacteriota bacterium]|nr:hypothetical protein [Acidobacteriota bacterium]